MVWGKCPGHDGDRAGEPRKVRGPQARDWWRGAPGVDGGSCRPGAARHSKSSAPGRVSRGTAGCAACRPPAHRPAAPLRLPAERRALVQHCRYRSGRPRGHPARCPWHRHRPRRPRPGWASPHPTSPRLVDLDRCRDLHPDDRRPSCGAAQRAGESPDDCGAVTHRVQRDPRDARPRRGAAPRRTSAGGSWR